MSFKRGDRIHLAGAGAIGLSHYGRAALPGVTKTSSGCHEQPVNTGLNGSLAREAPIPADAFCQRAGSERRPHPSGAVFRGAPSIRNFAVPSGIAESLGRPPRAHL